MSVKWAPDVIGYQWTLFLAEIALAVTITNRLGWPGVIILTIHWIIIVYAIGVDV